MNVRGNSYAATGVIRSKNRVVAPQLSLDHSILDGKSNQLSGVFEIQFFKDASSIGGGG